MEAVKLLPVALNVQNKRCLVVGGGPVAMRKVKSLVECGARVIVIAPAVYPTFPTSHEQVIYVPRPYQPGDCVNYALIFACTDDGAVNAAVAEEAARLDILCSVVDDAAASDFHSAATLRRGDICIGITTQGGSPALARYLQSRISACIGGEFEQLLDIMSTRRATVKGVLRQQADRAAAWSVVLESEALELLKAGERARAEALVDELLQLRNQ